MLKGPPLGRKAFFFPFFFFFGSYLFVCSRRSTAGARIGTWRVRRTPADLLITHCRHRHHRHPPLCFSLLFGPRLSSMYHWGCSGVETQRERWQMNNDLSKNRHRQQPRRRHRPPMPMMMIQLKASSAAAAAKNSLPPSLLLNEKSSLVIRHYHRNKAGSRNCATFSPLSKLIHFGFFFFFISFPRDL